MGFWNVVGKIGKGALDVAIFVVKEIPVAAGKQAGRHLDSNENLPSENRAKLEQIAERGKIADQKNIAERKAKAEAEAERKRSND